MGVGTVVARQARAENPETNIDNTIILSLEKDNKNTYYKVRNIFNNNRAPGFTMVERATSS